MRKSCSKTFLNSLFVKTKYFILQTHFSFVEATFYKAISQRLFFKNCFKDDIFEKSFTEIFTFSRIFFQEAIFLNCILHAICWLHIFQALCGSYIFQTSSENYFIYYLLRLYFTDSLLKLWFADSLLKIFCVLFA